MALIFFKKSFNSWSQKAYGFVEKLLKLVIRVV